MCTTCAPLEDLKLISYEKIIISLNKITPLHIISLHELKHLTIHVNMQSLNYRTTLDALVLYVVCMHDMTHE